MVEKVDEVSSSPAEIEVRMSGESVLVKILCEKRKGVLVKILDEIEKMNMSVVSASLTQAGVFTLFDNIVVSAQMDKESWKPAATKDDIITTFRSILLHTDEN